MLYCLLFFAAYIALILYLQTDTARRATAPPWYSWTKLPSARTRAQVLWLLPPAAIFTAWLLALRQFSNSRLFIPLAVLFVLTINASTAMMDRGFAAISAPFNRPGTEYFSDVPRIHSIHQWLHDYVALLPSYALHTRTHPPGAVLVLYLASKWISPGVTVASWTAIAITATAVIPAFFLAKKIYGKEVAAIFVGLYAVTPSLVLFGATSMDGVFLSAILWSLYLFYRAAQEPDWRWGILAGVSLSISLMLTFATVGILVLILIYAMLSLKVHGLRRPAFNLFISGIVCLAIFVAINQLTGFNLLRCLSASRHSDHYVMRTFQLATGRYFDISFSNLFAFLIGTGFVIIALWWEFFRRSGRDTLQVATVITIVGLSFAGLFTHETERIWLFFIPLPLMAAAKAISDSNNKRQLFQWAMAGLFLQTWLCQTFLYTMW